MKDQKEKGNDNVISLNISNFDSGSSKADKEETRKRYCDICNVAILPAPHHLCPNCGRWYGELGSKQGKHEAKIKGLDGRSQHKGSGGPSIIVSMVKDKELPKSDESGKDKLPPSFKMMERKGMNITGWTDSSVT